VNDPLPRVARILSVGADGADQRVADQEVISVGILSNLFGNSSSMVDLPNGDRFEIVGESYHQNVLNVLCGGKCEEGHQLLCHAVLVPESRNPHDANAVRVEIGGHTVGHLSRSDAATYRRRFGTAHGKCDAVIVGGWDRGNGDEGLNRTGFDGDPVIR
jgi:hypothetical protein